MKRLVLFSVLSIFCLTISAQTKTWIGPSGGSFNVAANWNPAGVPGTINDVIIPTGSNIEIDGANIKSIVIEGNAVVSLTNTLTFSENSTVASNATVNWTFGYLDGGTITNNGTFNFSSVNNKGMNGNTLFINNGAFNMNSDELLVLNNINHGFTNTSTGVINLNAGGQITHQLGGGSGLLLNSGLIKKQQSNGGFLILAAFQNDNGTITVENGTLDINSENGDVPNAILNDGIYNVSSGQTLIWNSGFDLSGTLTGQLVGALEWNGTINIASGTEAIFDFDGPGLTWTNGNLLGDGTLINRRLLNLGGSATWTVSGQSILRNEGVIDYNIAGFLILEGTSTLDNTSSGLINLNAGGQITYSSGVGTLANSGLVRKQGSSDTFVMFATMNNLASGTFESETGLLEFMNYAGTGTLTGNGSVKLPSGTTFEGTISPGGFPGTLTHEGNYTASANAILATEIYGPTAGTEYDVFDIQGNAIMDGNILLHLRYPASLNDEFIIVTANSITSCNLPNTVVAHYGDQNYTFDVICNPDNVTLKITDIVLSTEENTLSNLSMYPNPSNGHFTIDLGKEYTDVTLQIYNMLGQQISSEKHLSAKVIEKQLNASAGTYFVKVSTAKEGSKTLRIIKQ